MVSTWVKEKSESFSPPLWDVWELDLVSFIEQYLFSKEMVPKNRQSPGKMYSWPGQLFSDLPHLCSHLSVFRRFWSRHSAWAEPEGKKESSRDEEKGSSPAEECKRKIYSRETTSKEERS